MHFASDNSGPAPQQIMDALVAANTGYAMPYGNDDWTTRAVSKIRNVFEAPEAAVYFVGVGTAANALALACLCPQWGRIYAHHEAHIELDECAAPEAFIGGGRMHLIAGDHGKIDADVLTQTLTTAPRDVHSVQPGVLSLTNLTEAGTAYTVAEITRLAAIAKDAGIPTHLDGARFANALATLGCSPAELSHKAGVDVLSLGGTKNGLINVEAVILFDPKMAREFELRRKRAGHLSSKNRYAAAQMLAYLEGDLWLDLAARANECAGHLATALQDQGAVLTYTTDGNQVFASFPRAVHRRLEEAGAQYYLWPGTQSLDGDPQVHLTARMVCNWSTTQAEIDNFVSHFE